MNASRVKQITHMAARAIFASRDSAFAPDIKIAKRIKSKHAINSKIKSHIHRLLSVQ
jgi:hypothetical protein